MMYENQVSDELLDRWVTDVLLKHPEGMTGRKIYEMIRWHQTPDGTILDSHVVNSYLYSNCWGYQAKYSYKPDFKPIWFLRHPKRFPVIFQTTESIESMAANMVLEIVKTIRANPSVDERKMARETAMKLIHDKGSAITDMLYRHFTANKETFSGNKELFCTQKLSVKALDYLDYIDAT